MSGEYAYRRRWSSVAVVFLAGTLVLVAGGLVPGTDRSPDSVKLVRSYLTAVKERKVGEALRIAKKRPSGKEASFLKAAAMSGDWEILGLEETSAYEGAESVTVTAVLGSGKVRGRTEIEVVKENGGLRIKEPFAEVEFGSTALWYVEIGGVRVPDDRLDGKYLLFPGAYRYYQGRPDLFTVAQESDLLLPGEIAAADTSEIELTSRGERAVSQAVNAYVDGCVGKNEVEVPDCTFGVGENIRRPGGYILGIEDITWKVKEYPVVAVGTTGLSITDRRRGTVELRATGAREDGPRKRITVSCEIVTSRLEAGIRPDGTISVAPQGSRRGQASPYSWETCDG
ncbi:hypothetical protein [Spirillospora sp. NBC_01491]|uniref:hypothetical protein n=1 Tax=Spirillospora sp. NBC_01491 TaxID=2976007 RepID=UPI002E355050|nr:hypothetical protein [Spirillospora sp. NBC_01491]